MPLPLTGTDYLELLPVRFHPVTGRGIRITYRTYDHACLNEHRGRPCPTSTDGKWEVHLNPHDVRQIYIRLPDGHLHEIPWIHRDHVHAPMNETTWRHIRAALTRRADRDTHEAALADTADHILRRSRPHTPTAATATATTTAADGTGAAGRPGTADHPVGTGPVRPSAEELEEAEDSLDALEAPAPDHADTDRETGRQGGQAAAGYALYDAGEEAEHW